MAEERNPERRPVRWDPFGNPELLRAWAPLWEARTFCAAKYPMGLLEMNGCYPLTDEAVDETVTRTSPGNYALGYMDGTTFMVFYVGRSDSDVRGRLHEWVGAPSRYERYASPAKASWGVHRRGQLPVDAPALSRVENAESSYTHFAYSYARSAEEAYAKEWRNYHDFGGSDGLDNGAHPVSTPGSSGECLVRDQ